MRLIFDGDIDDVASFENELRQKGYKIISISKSRWLGRDSRGDPIDLGGRFDIELEDDHLLQKNKGIIASLEADIKTNPKVKKSGKD